jgi:hypothetical protein
MPISPQIKRLPASLTGLTEPSLYPEYVLAFHSSKRLLIEQLNSSYHLLADAIINLTLAKGNNWQGDQIGHFLPIGLLLNAQCTF